MNNKTTEQMTNMNHEKCIEYLKEVLPKLGGKVDIEKYNTHTYCDEGELDENTSQLSLVKSVFTDGDGIYLEMVHCNKYTIENVTDGDLTCVTFAVKDVFNKSIYKNFMVKFEQTYDKWLDLNIQLRNDSVEYINHILTTIGDRIYFDDETNVCVTYDGGNHPEYDANPYSHVEGVFLKDNKIYLETEDCSEYPLLYITANEIADIAFAVKDQIERDYSMDEDDE